jgi:hypothetical protein
MMNRASGRRRSANACHLIAAIVLALISGSALADPGYVPPWQENYQRDEFLLRRLSYVLERLIELTRGEPQLNAALRRMSLRTPILSDDESSPNAYALPSKDKAYVLFESRFAGQIRAISEASAYLALFQTDAAIDAVCAQLEADEVDARKRGAAPVFATELERFPQSTNPGVMRAMRLLAAMIADEAMVWFLLHEAGHHVLDHHPTGNLADNRILEAEADRWASQTTQRLGFGLFGAERFLNGRAVIEACLEELGHPISVPDSTHPSWLARTRAVRKEFDVVHTGRGTLRMFVLPGPANDWWFHIPESGQDGPSRITLDHESMRAAEEWQGNQLTVYARTPADDRVVFRVEDGFRALMIVSRTSYDSANRLIGKPSKFLGIQMNPAIIEWMEVEPGVRIAEIHAKSANERLADALRAVGLGELSLAAVVKASEEFRATERKLRFEFVKGTLSKQAAREEYERAKETYRLTRVANMQPGQQAALEKRILADPFTKWSEGKDGEYYKNLVQELIERNYREDK